MPGSSVLRALAHALGVTERYLLNPRQIDLTGIELRAGIVGSAKELGSVKAQVLGSIEKYMDVEELVPGADREWVQPKGFPYPVTEVADAEQAASLLRAAWGLGTQAISDIAEVVEQRGVKVIALKLDPRIAGILCTVQRGNHRALPVIAINADAQGERQRFGLVRELAHLVLDLGKIKEDAETVCDTIRTGISNDT